MNLTAILPVHEIEGTRSVIKSGKITGSSGAEARNDISSNHGDSSEQQPMPVPNPEAGSDRFEVTRAGLVRVRAHPYSAKHLFECSDCNQRFTRYENLKRHQKCHTDAPAFQCMYCTQTFLRADLRKRHVKRKHPVEFENETTSKLAKLPPDSSIIKPVFTSEDIPSTYHPRLHKWLTKEMPFLPPDFFDHYVDLYLSKAQIYLPMIRCASVSDTKKVSASFLRAVSCVGCLCSTSETDSRLGFQFFESGVAVLDLFVEQDAKRERLNNWVLQSYVLLALHGTFSNFGDASDVVRARLFSLVSKLRSYGWLQLGDVSGDNQQIEDIKRICFGAYFVCASQRILFNYPLFLSYAEIKNGVPIRTDVWNNFKAVSEINLAKETQELSEILRQLSTAPISILCDKTRELVFTSLILVCAINEIAGSVTHLVSVVPSYTHEGKKSILRLLTNLSLSIPENTEIELDLFWSFWHFTILRMNCKCLYPSEIQNTMQELIASIVSEYRTSTRTLSATDIMQEFDNTKDTIDWALNRLYNCSIHSKLDTAASRLTLLVAFLSVFRFVERATRENTDIPQLYVEQAYRLMTLYPLEFREGETNEEYKPESVDSFYRLFHSKLILEGAWGVGNVIASIVPVEFLHLYNFTS